MKMRNSAAEGLFKFMMGTNHDAAQLVRNQLMGADTPDACKIAIRAIWTWQDFPCTDLNAAMRGTAIARVKELLMPVAALLQWALMTTTEKLNEGTVVFRGDFAIPDNDIRARETEIQRAGVCFSLRRGFTTASRLETVARDFACRAGARPAGTSRVVWKLILPRVPMHEARVGDMIAGAALSMTTVAQLPDEQEVLILDATRFTITANEWNKVTPFTRVGVPNYSQRCVKITATIDWEWTKAETFGTIQRAFDRL
jgi:hypothetical protein